MLLDLGRNDISRVSKPGTVKVTDKMYIEYFSHVMHIVSNIEAQLKNKKDSTDVLFSGFPAGTVTGAPKIRAIEIIEKLEKSRKKYLCWISWIYIKQWRLKYLYCIENNINKKQLYLCSSWSGYCCR